LVASFVFVVIFAAIVPAVGASSVTPALAILVGTRQNSGEPP
jgi:hypothetical protein